MIKIEVNKNKIIINIMNEKILLKFNQYWAMTCLFSEMVNSLPSININGSLYKNVDDLVAAGIQVLEPLKGKYNE